MVDKDSTAEIVAEQIRRQNVEDREKEVKDKRYAQLKAELERDQKAEAQRQKELEKKVTPPVVKKQSLPKDTSYIEKKLAEGEAQRKSRMELKEAEQNALSNPKLNAVQRIKIRQQSEARQLATQQQMESAIRGEGRVKAAIRKGVQKVPSGLDRAVTGSVNRAVDVLGTSSIRNPNKFYKQETTQVSRALKSRPQKPVTGGKVQETPILAKNAIVPNPNFMDALLGRTPIQTQTSKTQAAKSGKKPQKRDMMDGLNNFMRMI